MKENDTNNREPSLETILTKLTPQEQEYVLDQIQRDSLTGLFNRKYYDNNIGSILSESYNKGKNIGVIMIDVDKFKFLNDKFGHARGDEVLRRIARIIDSSIKVTDYAIRWGGEEFLVILKDADENIEKRVIERINKKIANYNDKNKVETVDEHRAKWKYVLGISVGYACWNYSKKESIDSIINLADKRMYKQKGRKQ